ncbi:MAG: hypothetical protein J5J00_07245 [Deltaproteobacteria bacterium]|nr:hypothetical protein [Deltaproteobacteria bacterium]
MKQAFTPGLCVSGGVTVRKDRELAVPGEILVREGDSVEPTQVVGRAQLQGELLILRLSEQLGIQPDEALQGLKVKLGDSVSSGQIICEHAGLFGLLKSRYLAPRDGTIEFITERTGHVGLRLPSKPIELKAYLGGKVISVTPARALRIEARCSMVQGIFGVGGEQHGQLQAIAAPSEALVDEMLPAVAEGKVLFGGHSPSEQFLKTAAERGAVGLITGSMDDKALKGYLGYDLGLALTGNENVTMSVIITEGFGSIAMSERAHKLLSSRAGQNASMTGATQVRAGAIRPEVLIIESGGAEKKGIAEGDGLQIGSKIRIIRVPYFGLRGEVVELPFEQTKIETGAYTRVLRARLEDGRVVTVPRANVEL